MKCIKCNNKAVQDRLCYHHYIDSKEEIFSDNSNIDNLGIIQWAKYFLPHHVKNEFPPKHKFIYAMLLNLYSSEYRNKYERLRALRAFREYSKTGTIRIFTLYILMHSNKVITIPKLEFEIKNNQIESIKVVGSEKVKIEEKFIVIVSETGSQAEEFTTAIRDEISTNSLIHYFYGSDIIEEVEQEGLIKISDRKSRMQWTRRAFRVNKVSILGIGAKQRIRGRIKGASRPTTIFFDDIYSEENVKTKESRESIRKWFNNAAMKTVDMVVGKAYLVGTVVSDDTVIVDIKNNPQWKSMEIPVMELSKFNKLVKEHLKVDKIQGICELPYQDDIIKCREYFRKLDDGSWGLEWGDRIGLYEIALMYKEAIYNRSVSGFYQEYFHIIIPEEDKRFKSEYFRRIEQWRLTNKYGFNILEYKYKDKEEKVNVNLNIGIDLGTGTLSGDDTVMVLTAIDSEGRYYVLDIKAGKYSYFDTDNNEGIYDIVLRLSKRHKIKYVNIGYAGSEKGHIEGLRQYMKNNGIYQLIIGRKQLAFEGNKFERITNNLLHLYQQGKVFHTNCTGIDRLEYQLEYLGKADRDDIADALEVSIYNSLKPNQIDIVEEGRNHYRPFIKYSTTIDEYRNFWRN